MQKIKALGSNWLVKKKEKKIKVLPLCLGGCGNTARSTRSKFCWDCIEKREHDRMVKQSKKNYLAHQKRKHSSDALKKFGSACKICGKRKEIFSATGGAEGGRDSICTCK